MATTEDENRRDYLEIAKAYAWQAITNRKVHGLYIRQACVRFLRDLERAEDSDCDFYFDEWHAFDACDFIEKLPHVEGKWETPTITLDESQIWFVVSLFGFRLKEDGTRRFTSALFATARKNAKSTLGAAIMLYCFCCEEEPGAQIISAASTYDQACKVFGPAKRMVEMTPDLRDAFGIEPWAKSISRFEIGGSFKPIHAKASTQDGLNPSHTALDEIHAHKTPDLVNVLTSAAGARSNSLWLYTTTEGYLNAGPWGDLRRYCVNILKGVFSKKDTDHFLVALYCIDKNDDEFDESCWPKANPLWNVNPILRREVRKMATEAKGMPSKLSEFRIKRLNRSAQVADGFINLHKWKQCAEPVDLDYLERERIPCWGGLDLSSTTDLCSFFLVWRVGEKLYAKGWRWCPEEAIAYRTERNTVPYASWVESGFMKQAGVEVIDHNIVREDILDLYKRFNVESIAYDSWNAVDVVSYLIENGVDMIQFIQGPKSYHPAIQQLEIKYRSGNFAHGGDPVFEWCASNLVIRYDVNLNMAPDKRKSAEKIDDISACSMAIGISGIEVDNNLDDFMQSPVTG